jgi:hypothetical protein
MMCDLCKEHSNRIIRVNSWQVCQWCISNQVLDQALARSSGAPPKNHESCEKMKKLDTDNRGLRKFIYAACVALALSTAAASMARAAGDPPKAWQDVRALVVRFNDAENSQNSGVLSALLLDSPDLNWSSGLASARGHEAVVAQLPFLYGGTMTVLPDYGALTIDLLSPIAADVTMPTQFRSESLLSDAVMTTTVVREHAVKTADGWRLSSIDTQPAPVRAR